MIQALIHKLLKHRHFWRYATFSEVAELYASRTIRIFAIRLIAMFTSIYLYQLGYSLTFIVAFWIVFYTTKALFAIVAAHIAAQFGPKHGTLASNLISAVSMALLPLIPQYGIYALTAWCVLQGFSACLYDLCYLIDFSKVKNIEHAGKEIGYMNILEKVAAASSPVVGGVIALWLGPEAVMILSSSLFMIAAWPLFRTGEPTRIRQRLHFRGFPWRVTWRSFIAETGVGFDVFASGTAWTLFMLLIIFAGTGNELYVQIGAVSSAAFVATILASYGFGKIIDHKQARGLLQAGVAFNSITHVLRPFVGTSAGVVVTNIVNEAATTGYAMAFTRGMFDTADITGRRIVYLFFIEVVTNLGAALAAFLLLGLLLIASPDVAVRYFFFLASFITLIIGIPAFWLYRK